MDSFLNIAPAVVLDAAAVVDSFANIDTIAAAAVDAAFNGI